MGDIGVGRAVGGVGTVVWLWEVIMRWALVLVLVVAASCGGTGGAIELGVPSPGVAREQPLSVRWVRTSAEHRAAYLQAYRLAESRVRDSARGRASGTWGVILDADETILDNSQYQKERAELGLGYTQESWTEWVRREAADTLPGAAGFIGLVRDLGGRVAVVTNRHDFECADTGDNLIRLGVVVDLLLCRPSSAPSDKEPRFRSVEDGTADAAVGPLEILLWVGDNIQDFPGLTQEARTGPIARLDGFGSRFIVVPNPMYGSWERNPPR